MQDCISHRLHDQVLQLCVHGRPDEATARRDILRAVADIPPGLTPGLLLDLREFGEPPGEPGPGTLRTVELLRGLQPQFGPRVAVLVADKAHEAFARDALTQLPAAQSEPPHVFDDLFRAVTWLTEGDNRQAGRGALPLVPARSDVVKPPDQQGFLPSDLPADLPNWMRQQIALYFSAPATAHTWDSAPHGGPGPLPTLLLVTVGLSSGRPRPRPLAYIEDAGELLVAASRGGAQELPEWYVNLCAEPLCEAWVGTEHWIARGRTAPLAERQQRWPRLATANPLLDAHQQRAGDWPIPLVVLERLTRLSS